jgi:alpha-L-arabinofuranosidase
MKLWREHYAPFLIGMEGETKPLNAVATKSADGKTLHFKAVNPTQQSVQVELVVEGNNTVKSASMQVIAPGDLHARNTLEEPNQVRPEPAEVQSNSHTVKFALPPYSAGVVTINLQ